MQVSQEEEGHSISIPYIQGDNRAILNNELVRQLSESGQFYCVQNGGDFVLQVVLAADTEERIGYRYDRDNTSGKLEKNLIGVESRRGLVAEVTLLNAHTEEKVFGPCIVKASADFDYFDPGSPRDLSFVNQKGVPESVLQFSLGQLDSVEGAHDDASVPAYRLLSQKIVLGIMNRLQEIP